MRAVSSANPSWLGHETEVDSKLKKRENGRNSASRPLIKKIRPLYFLQFLKLKEIKWSYFCDLVHIGRVMAVFLFLSFESTSISCPSHEVFALDTALMAGTELSIPQAYFNRLGLQMICSGNIMQTHNLFVTYHM